MSSANLLVAIFVGLFAGWLVDLVRHGKGFALAGSLTMGMLGAIVAALLIPLTGFNAGREVFGVVINAALGAALLLLIIDFIRPDEEPDKTGNGGQP